MSDDRAKEVITEYGRLKGDRATTETHWQEVADYMLPDRADYTLQRTPGVKRMQKVFDSTALYAVQQASAGFHTYMTSTTERWFELRPDDDRALNDQQVHAWFDAATAAMYSDFSSPRMNFATASHEVWNDLLTIGTACMAVLEGRNGNTLFSTRHMSEVVFQENEEDRVDWLIRSWQFTAKQAFQAWGPACGESVVKALEKTPDRKFRFFHRVKPRLNRDPQRADKLHKPFESLYVGEADQCIIGEGGFDEFPFMVPRFAKSSGELCGRGQGMLMLPDVKMLNQMMQTTLIAAQQNIDPALSIPDDYFAVPIRSTPGAKNYHRAGMRDQVQRLFEGGDVRIGVEMMNAKRQDILRGFFVDWMVMPSDLQDPASTGKGVTATFTVTQRDQKFRLMSPTLARGRSELLGPLIERKFAMDWRRSVALRFGPGSPFPEPPPQMSGMPWRVEYISSAEIAQRSGNLDNIDRLVQKAVMLAQIDPTVANILNAENILRLAARALNAPALALRSPEEVAAAKQAEAEAQQQLAAHASMTSVANAAKDGSTAVKNIAGAMGGGGERMAA